jgi:hypothetical protein
MPTGLKGRPADVIGAAVKVMQIATGDIVTLIDKAAGEPKKRGSYRPRISN